MGTPAATTCGMKESELTKVGYLISEILKIDQIQTSLMIKR